eukprot:6172543-Pleurochrysis_carterae.AAC.3
MMNWARIQMKSWIATKNEHKANVQRRWDNRGKMHMAFQRWREKVRQEDETQTGREENGEGEKERVKTYGIKYRGRVRSMPRIHVQLLGNKPPEMGALGPPESYILARGSAHPRPYLSVSHRLRPVAAYAAPRRRRHSAGTARLSAKPAAVARAPPSQRVPEAPFRWKLHFCRITGQHRVQKTLKHADHSAFVLYPCSSETKTERPWFVARYTASCFLDRSRPSRAICVVKSYDVSAAGDRHTCNPSCGDAAHLDALLPLQTDR